MLINILLCKKDFGILQGVKKLLTRRLSPGIMRKKVKTQGVIISEKIREEMCGKGMASDQMVVSGRVDWPGGPLDNA